MNQNSLPLNCSLFRRTILLLNTLQLPIDLISEFWRDLCCSILIGLNSPKLNNKEHMKRLQLFGAIATALATWNCQALDVKIYSVFSTADVGEPFSGLVGSFTSPDIMFGTATGFNWHPFGLDSFGADITGSINVAGGTYPISLFSDDGAGLFIDGVEQISRPGPHGPDGTTGTVTLTPGIHSVEVKFFECCSGPSGVDVVLPAGVVFTAPDTASTLGLLSGAFGILGAWRLRSRR